MSEITAARVKELREKTGAGMMDCRKALGETGGDLEAAVDWLRKKGLASAAKKAGRVAAEGLVAVAVSGTTGAVVAVNAATDFVGRNEKFQAFAAEVAQLALGVSGDDVAALSATKMASGETVETVLTQLVATIGENMSLRRMKRVSVKEGAVVPYMHGALTPQLGRIGVLIALESGADAAVLAGLGKQLAMHVAAANPQSLTIDAVDPAALERERAVLADQARASGKAEEIIGKMVEGRLRKYYEETVLLEQVFVVDGESRVKDVVAKAGKEAGKPVALTGFVRFALGEGIEKQQTDFAAEVAAQAGL